ncbi:MAG: shikimate kinase, partial [Clostridia bacterium]|nr:shikimate kinase [Clostridia bacterium]
PQHMITETLNAITAQCENIVLIGMPGCGKSTVGALLADMLGRELVDTDAEIVAREGRSIPEIFAAEGESGFRAIEKEVVADVGRRRGLIIACGGGAVLDPANRIALRQNGRIYRLLRPLEALATDGRPLSATPERLQQLAREREPIYTAMADLSVDNIAAPEQAARTILRDFTHTAE